MKTLSTNLRVLLTAAVVVVAVAIVAVKYWDYVINPWTRNGQVQAQVVQITPRISGPIVNLPIEDNQFVKSGDLLFEVDPRTFAADLDLKRADLDKTRDDLRALQKQVEAAEATVEQYNAIVSQAEQEVKAMQARLAETKADFERYTNLVKEGAASKQQAEKAKADYEVNQADLLKGQAALLQAKSAQLQSQADLAKAEADLGAPGEDNARLRAAKAAVVNAELDLEFTSVKAPVDGYVTNLNLRLGDQAVTNQPALALIDVDSFWVYGFFRENYLQDMRAGDRAIVTLMSYADTPLEGRVESIGWGISQADGSTGSELLPEISPTFEWIRLAQRVPVRVQLTELPEDVKLRVGTTASVLVMTGTAEADSQDAVPAAPKALQ